MLSEMLFLFGRLLIIHRSISGYCQMRVLEGVSKYADVCHSEIITWWVNKVFKLFHCMKNDFSFKDFFSKCDQIHSFQRIWSHLLKKPLMENFIFYAVFLVCFCVFEICFCVTLTLFYSVWQNKYFNCSGEI